MAERRETVTVKMEEIMPLIEDYIRANCPDIPESAILEYTSKTKFLTFDVIRPGKKQ